MESDISHLLEEARRLQVSEADREEQRINFAFGNAPDRDKKTTKDSLRAVSKIMKAA